MKEKISETSLLFLEEQVQILLQNRNSLKKASYIRLVEKISSCTGKTIILGLGKSGDVGRKFSSTLNSVGIPSFFLPISEALHGGLGALDEKDVAIILSKSGGGSELDMLLDALVNINIEFFSITMNASSRLSQLSTVSIELECSIEGDQNNLLPTISTTLMQVVCDGICVSIADIKGFDEFKFGRIHPAGILGKRLDKRVIDMCRKENLPRTFANDQIREGIIQISKGGLGAAVVVDKYDQVLGIITDGDIRRMLEADDLTLEDMVFDLMTHEPISCHPEESVINACNIMSKHKITQLLVVTEGELKGILHFHDVS